MNTADAAANAGKENSPQQPVLNVGMTLREAREYLGMSVHDVAERIKFAPRQVEALEANDFAHLPQSTFLRGFVRSYARVLQLDEVALIAALPGEPPRQVIAKAQTVDVAFPTLRSFWRGNLLWLGGALGVVLVLGLFVLLHDVAPTAKPTEVVAEPVPLPAPEAAVSAVVDAEVVKPEATEPAKVAESRKAAEPKKATEPAKARQPVVTSAPSNAAVSAPVESAKPVVASEMLKRRPLHFVFVEDTWAEVIDGRGAVLLSRNNPRGSEKWVGGPRHEPYDISIAPPGNVRLYYKGNEIDLSAYPATGVAHLKVE